MATKASPPRRNPPPCHCATHKDDAQGSASVTEDMDVVSDCGEVEPRREHDSKEGGGRVMHGAITERPKKWPKQSDHYYLRIKKKGPSGPFNMSAKA